MPADSIVEFWKRRDISANMCMNWGRKKPGTRNLS